ncbi:hypothetical protein BC01_077 [Bacillus phage BC01]|nr:hypothetical protein PBC6_068 [Bacillus phage PBC6]AXU41174.1 hypothetical protein BC01_077 [Bacillus phage BC01]
MGLLYKLKNWKKYRIWRDRTTSKKFHDFKRGSGFYLHKFGYTGKNIWETEMRSGKVGIFQLVDCRFYSDPDDMVEYAWYQFLGYKGEKPVVSCTFEEFMELYSETFQPKK